MITVRLYDQTGTNLRFTGEIKSDYTPDIIEYEGKLYRYDDGDQYADIYIECEPYKIESGNGA